MHSVWLRTNAVLTFGASVLAGLCLLATITDSLRTAHTDVDLQVVGLESLQRESTDDQWYGRQRGGDINDRARLVVKLDADVRDEFKWNTKQLFMFLSVDYATPANPSSQLVMWSKIILSKAEAHLQISQLREHHPYAVADQGFGLRGQPFNVTVAWNIMPYVGIMRTKRRTFGSWQFPDQYVRPSEAELAAIEQEAASAAAAYDDIAEPSIEGAVP